MDSFVLLALVACVLGLPGVAASLAIFAPGEISVVTRAAAAFGLGYAASAGCAFLLAAVHAFRLSYFIASWLAASAALWLVALCRTSLREHARALGKDIAADRLPLLLGVLVLALLLILHFRFMHLLGAPRYVYFQGGVQIANSGGVPSSSLEYGQSWPPATDKIVLDAFTGVLVVLYPSIVIGPGVLLWFSILGSGLGLWATAWELGLRRTSILLPLLVVNNQVLFRTGSALQRVSTDFAEYRAEDFGRAVAYCALPLGIYAIRQRRWGPAVAAATVLAAASGTHLIPAVVVVIALCFAILAELIRAEGSKPRLMVLRQGVALGSVSAFLAVLIRLGAGGTFGLGGASSPAGYTAMNMRFDPTVYLFSGGFLRWDPPGASHWYVPPGQVVADLVTGPGIPRTAWVVWMLVILALLTAALLFLLAPPDLRITGMVGAGLLAGLTVAALFFAYHYHVYVDGTFGVRRLPDFSTIGLAVLALGALEALLVWLRRHLAPRAWLALTVAIVAAVSAWVLPASAASQPLLRVSRERVTLVNWLRTHTPCNARFLVNERTEGAFTVLTGRFALLEGMGAFLRVDKLPYVVSLSLAARQFFQAPLSHEAFLRQHGISYVVVTRQNQLLGYGGPTGKVNEPGIHATPFLQPVLVRYYITVYHVRGAHPPPSSTLLKGPYLHCITSPVRF